MGEIMFREYRDYIENRVRVNNAMMALLAGSKLAAHTLSLTSGSNSTLAEVFPTVEHIKRFNLRSDSARDLLNDADQYIASVTIPYALATHEDFVIKMLHLLESEGVRPITHGRQVKAWNMHEVLFETCGYLKPVEWLETFHVIREIRNSIIHSGELSDSRLNEAISRMGDDARHGWSKLNRNALPEATIDSKGRLALTAENVFTSLAVTKRLGREINRALANRLDTTEWARLAISDFHKSTTKIRNSSGWRRSAIGFARQYYSLAGITEGDIEQAARKLGFWTIAAWK
ncbi:hypothetical protein [Propionimicrobium lymphophilum]|uniref:hypothetical protein n=1 Tax=Propionimicrobium lymphophilum TaxID=33012 RepID=UPI00048F61E2|nr:hypothetical protein [Propionimicrobium lymphophilum]